MLFSSQVKHNYGLISHVKQTGEHAIQILVKLDKVISKYLDKQIHILFFNILFLEVSQLKHELELLQVTHEG
jgi:hypothetical protein